MQQKTSIRLHADSAFASIDRTIDSVGSIWQEWRSAALRIRNAVQSKAEMEAKTVHFQFRQAVSRWKKLAKSARDRALLEKRAYFFLYFCLMKKSLRQLRKHAALKKSERALMRKAERSVKQRAFQRMVIVSRQRGFLRRVLLAWRGRVGCAQAQESASQSIKLLVYNRYRGRILSEAFHSWHDRYLRKQLCGSIIRVLHRHSSRLIELAWRTWRQHIYKVAQLQKWEDIRRTRATTQIWTAWVHRMNENRRKELRRRLAVRFSYRRLLRQGFDSFVVALYREQTAVRNADRLSKRRNGHVVGNAFAQWNAFTTRKRVQTRKYLAAAHLCKVHLIKRVWRHGWVGFLASKRFKKTVIENALHHHRRNLMNITFQRWKDERKNQKAREDALVLTAESFKREKDDLRTQRAFYAWADYVRKCQANRLVSAHARGQWQVRLIRKCFSHWMERISEIRWKQIQNQRAQQLSASKLKEKCFRFWKRKVEARKQYCDQNRTALIHWKLTMERMFFAHLKRYAARRKAERARVHDALEFRHSLIVSDGVRHWMTAALYLQDQRETQVSRSQATHAARIWRKVAQIARHWRALAVERRQGRGSTRTSEGAYRTGDTWFTGRSHAQRVQRRLPPVPLQARQVGKETQERPRSSQPVAAEPNTTTRSALSEFVRLPTNRPQPRRPIELLLETPGSDTLRQPRSTENVEAKAPDNLYSKYGFNFPAQPFQPLDLNSCHRKDHAHQQETLCPSPNAQTCKSQDETRELRTRAPAKNAPISHLDALEAQLLEWTTRKQEFRAFQRRLEHHRRFMQDPSLQE